MSGNDIRKFMSLIEDDNTTADGEILNESIKDIFKDGFMGSIVQRMNNQLPSIAKAIERLDNHAKEIEDYGNDKAKKLFKNYHDALSDAYYCGNESDLKGFFAAMGRVAALKQDMGLI